VTFDADARKEFLTGFRKRKQERRKNAANAREKLQKMKQREDRSEKRKEIKEMIESRIDDEFANEQRIKARKRRKQSETKRSESTFTDTFTENAFGSDTVVVVTTSEGIDEGEFNSDGNEIDEFEDLARELRAQIGDSIRKPNDSNVAKKSTKQKNKKKKKNKKKNNNARKVKGKKQKKGHKARRKRR